jgi:5-methylcytosine-specific restriction endonuclease McrA
LTVDHIKPRSKYPALALVLSNLRVLCRRCNSSREPTSPVGS